MDEVSGDDVIAIDCSRRALPSLAPYFAPSFPGAPAPLEQLEALDASRNVLASLRGLEHLPRLRVLSLYFNRVEQFAELLRLRPAAASLHTLDLRLNPVARLEGYRGCAVFCARRRPLFPRFSTPALTPLFPSPPCAALSLRCCPRSRCWTKRR